MPDIFFDRESRLQQNMHTNKLTPQTKGTFHQGINLVGAQAPKHPSQGAEQGTHCDLHIYKNLYVEIYSVFHKKVSLNIVSLNIIIDIVGA